MGLNNINLKTIILALVIAFGLGATNGYAQDTVFLNTGRPVRGKISNSTPDEIRVGDQTIPIQDIKNVSFSGAPRELGRAVGDMDNGQYNDALAQLQKITELPTGMALQEYNYIDAFVAGKLALQGGSVSIKEAGGKIGTFLNQNPNSFRAYPLIELYGELYVAVNQIEKAEAEFEKLANSSLPDYQLRGLFSLGQAQLLTGKHRKAKSSFETLQGHPLNDVNAQQYKAMAKVQAAKASALLDKESVAEAKATIEKIIKEENPDNKQLFAYCYNALGVCRLQENDSKGAALAFLHTDLLFSTEREAHAEALYNLNKLWTAMEETDRANRARQTLNSNYANSFWKLKLTNGG